MTLAPLLATKEVGKLFRDAFEFDPINVKTPISAPPAANNPALVGTAFGYLVRFWLERRHQTVHSQTWAAERAANSLSVRGGKYVCVVYGDEERLVLKEEFDRARKIPEDCTSIRESGGTPAVALVAAGARTALGVAKTTAISYIESGTVDDDLFRAAIMLARLDAAYHTGDAGYVGGIVDYRDVEDLRNLWNVLEDGGLRDLRGPVWLNPTFGRASSMGADVIAGDTVLDVVTEGGGFTREHFDRLVGCCVLDHLAGKRGTQDKPGPLQRAGIYFARHGVLVTVDVGGVYDSPAFVGCVDRLAEVEARNSQEPDGPA